MLCFRRGFTDKLFLLLSLEDLIPVSTNICPPSPPPPPIHKYSRIFVPSYFYHVLLVGMAIFPPGMNICPKENYFLCFWGNQLLVICFPVV